MFAGTTGESRNSWHWMWGGTVQWCRKGAIHAKTIVITCFQQECKRETRTSQRHKLITLLAVVINGNASNLADVMATPKRTKIIIDMMITNRRRTIKKICTLPLHATDWGFCGVYSCRSSERSSTYLTMLSSPRKKSQLIRFDGISCRKTFVCTQACGRHTERWIGYKVTEWRNKANEPFSSFYC